jgi:hypothetical protein
VEIISKYKQKVKANIDVIMTVWVNEDVNGNKEIEDVEDIADIREINDWEGCWF